MNSSLVWRPNATTIFVCLALLCITKLECHIALAVVQNTLLHYNIGVLQQRLLHHHRSLGNQFRQLDARQHLTLDPTISMKWIEAHFEINSPSVIVR